VQGIEPGAFLIPIAQLPHIVKRTILTETCAWRSRKKVKIRQ